MCLGEQRLCASLAGPSGGLLREPLRRKGAAASRPRGAAGGPQRLGAGSRRRPLPAPRPGGAGGSSRSRETCGPRARRFAWAGATPSAQRGPLSPCRAGDPAFPPGGVRAPAAGKTALSGGQEKSIPGALLQNESPRRRREDPPCECLRRSEADGPADRHLPSLLRKLGLAVGSAPKWGRPDLPWNCRSRPSLPAASPAPSRTRVEAAEVEESPAQRDSLGTLVRGSSGLASRQGRDREKAGAARCPRLPASPWPHSSLVPSSLA